MGKSTINKTLTVSALIICITCSMYFIHSYSNSLMLFDARNEKTVPKEDHQVPFSPKFNSTWQELLCAGKNFSSELQEDIQVLPLMHRDEEPNVTLDNIFFLETSCSPEANYRYWCSVESWAKLYPERQIWYVMTSPFLSDPVGLMRRITERYKNIRMVEGNLEETFKDVPLQDLFMSNRWIKNSTFPATKLSDILRPVLLYKYGGIYSDTDVISIRRIPGDLMNSVTFQSEDTLNGAVIQSQPKHHVLLKLMNEIATHFNGYIWGNDGPDAVTKVMQSVCNVTDFKPISKNGTSCGNMTILTAEHFYPIAYQFHEQYTNLVEKPTDIQEKFNNTFGLHFWNKMSSKNAIKIGGNSILDLAAKTSCPVTYKMAGFHSKFFR